MSSGSAPPTVGTKPAAAAFTSSFINKNTSGKKFAPKAAVRRRPAAAASTTQTLATESSISTSAIETRLESQAVPNDVLPTPAATQESTPQAEEAALEAPVTTAGKAIETPPPSATVTEAALAPAPAGVDRSVQKEVAEDVRGERPLKRRRIQAAGEVTQSPTASVPSEINTGHVASVLQELESVPQDSTELAAVGQSEARLQTIETSHSEDEGLALTEGRAALVDSAQTTTESSRPNRSLPWVAVNQPQQGDGGDREDEVASDVAIPNPEEYAPSRIPDTTTTIGIEAEEQGSRTTRRRARAAKIKDRQHPTSTSDDAENAFETVERPIRRPRKTRKDKGMIKKGKVTEDSPENDEAVQEVVEDIHPKQRTVRRRKKSRTVDDANRIQEGGDVDQASRSRRTGRMRESTPSDAEERRIEPETTSMNSLAARGYRYGKVSEREKKMREINWEEVRQRRKEEEMKHDKAEQAAIDAKLKEAAEERSRLQERLAGPQFREVNGQIEIVARTIDREAEADRELEVLEIHEEDDLTKRITTTSFLRNNKRFPKEFMLPGQGRRWNEEGTEVFYDALRMFGPNFQIISSFFPGSTRRSIKNKFNREERENPDRIDEAVKGSQSRDIGWNDYLAKTNQEDVAFVDPDAFEQEQERERERFKVLIDEARKEHAEELRQKQLAGVDMSGDEGGGKENGKGNKKKMGKGETFAKHDDVEILGDVDDEDF